MKRNIHLILLLVSIISVLKVNFISGQKWTGSGDGTSWNDGANWEGGAVPAAKAQITFQKAATVTGTVPNVPSIIKVQKDITVTFDLNLTIGDGVDEQHALTIAQNATVNLGTNNTNRTITIFTSKNKQGIASFGANNNSTLNIAKGTTVIAKQTQFGINMGHETSVVNNYGTIIIESLVTTGIKSVGIVNNHGTINGTQAGNNGIIMAAPGHFYNHEDGVIDIMAATNDCIELQDGSSFTNKGKLNLSKGPNASTFNSSLSIAGKTLETKFTHDSEFPLNITGASDSSRVVMVDTKGVFENHGVVNFSGMAFDSSFTVLGELHNMDSSFFNFDKGSVMVTETGKFVNHYIITKGEPAAVFNTSGTATNHGFFNYNGGGPFFTGTGTIEDFGLAFVDTLDAGGSCAVDLTDIPLEWFEGVNSLGMSNENGQLTFGTKSLQNNPATLTTTIPGVNILVKNYCPEAWNGQPVLIALKWTGSGDGTSWHDGANWEGGQVPVTNAQITFQKAATVTGTVPNVPSIIKVQKDITVTFDLDLTIGDGLDDQHALTIAQNATVNLGTDEAQRTFTLFTPQNKQGIASFGSNNNSTLNIAKGTTVIARQTQFGINMGHETSVVNNHGTIIIDSMVTTGIKSVGAFHNHGTINGLSAGNNGIIMVGPGHFMNHEDGKIDINAKYNDCIEMQDGSSFTNKGKLTLTKDSTAAKLNSALVISGKTLTTKFIHDSTFPLNITGNSDSSLVVMVDTMGIFENHGIVHFSGMAFDSSFTVFGELHNMDSSFFNFDKGSVMVTETGKFVNHYIITKGDPAAVFSTSGNATNHGFFNYAGGGPFFTGTGTIEDSGLAFVDTLDAGGSCTVDLTDIPLEWFEGTKSLGMSDANGELTFAPASLVNKPAVLTTSIEGVFITIENYCPEAWIDPSGTDNLIARNLQVFPTYVPFGWLHIVMPEGVSMLNVHMLDLSGRVQKTTTISGEAVNRLDVSQLAEGMYILKAEHEGKIYIARFIK